MLSFPGLGTTLAARVLAEIGGDRTHCADARGLKAYAGSSPITRASGKKSSITRRWVKNDRLNHAGYLWAFAAQHPRTAGSISADAKPAGHRDSFASMMTLIMCPYFH